MSGNGKSWREYIEAEIEAEQAAEHSSCSS